VREIDKKSTTMLTGCQEELERGCDEADGPARSRAKALVFLWTLIAG